MKYDYDLELEKIAEKINQEKAGVVLIQLPDGLKPKAREIKEFLKGKVNPKTKIVFWAGSCFGACDIPTSLANLNIDLLIHIGHSEWK